MPLAEYRSRRPIASGKVHEVDNGRWQGRCVCRWHGRRRANRLDADIETAAHVAACGLCILLGRDYYDRCTCFPCTRRREVRALWEKVGTRRSGEHS